MKLHHNIISIAAISAVLILTAGSAISAIVQPTSSITVEIHKGRMIKLPRAAASVLIADPAVADIDVKSPTLLYVFGKAIGETTLYAMDDDENRIIGVNVNVTHNISRLNSIIRSIKPGLNIRFRSVDNGIVMDGDVAHAKEALEVQTIAQSFLEEGDTLVNMLKVKGAEQVTISLRIAEVARTELKQFGINLQSILRAGDFLFSIANGRDFIGGGGTIIREAGQGAIAGSYTGRRIAFDGLIDALAQEGFVSILAEPNLTAISGKSAKFLAGGEFPIPIADADGQVTVEFREYGVELDFTPTVLEDGRINLEIKPEVSTLTEAGAVEINGFSIPALSTRRTETTVELEDGQSFAIAGLLQHDSANNFDKFPGLGDIPVLGTLFRSSRFERNETELVVIVTPHIIKKGQSNILDVNDPVKHLEDPNDVQRLLLGKLYVDRRKTLSDDGNTYLPKLHGPVGFVLE